MSTTYSIGSMNQLGDALETSGFTPDDLTKLRQWKALPDVLGVLRGTHQILPFDHVTDLAVPCELPFAGVERISPAKSGLVKLECRGDDLFVNDEKINLFLSEQQKRGVHLGHDLQKVVEARGGNLSARIMDYLKLHPVMWPESWKKDAQGNTIYVFFWDDIFRSSGGSLCVRYGYWSGGEVVSHCHWLDLGWNSDNPSASVK